MIGRYLKIMSPNNPFLGILIIVLNFSCCHRTPGKINFRRDGFISACSLRVQFLMEDVACEEHDITSCLQSGNKE